MALRSLFLFLGLPLIYLFALLRARPPSHGPPRGCVRWRSFSDFKRLAQTLWDVDERLSRIAGGVSLFVNAQRSWACVRRRQHCFRNLDVDYLTIKAFLLERFLHDALYEAPTAEVFNEFLDIRPAPAAQVSFASSPSLPRSAVSGSLSR